ncbi:MAG: hypothetical protein NWQ20_05705, partial [Algoriphagus sp.]|nr:hypothetical protein [Algoriphagus sp.]
VFPRFTYLRQVSPRAIQGSTRYSGFTGLQLESSFFSRRLKQKRSADFLIVIGYVGFNPSVMGYKSP